ncbi:MAG: hypothetical protein KBH29_11340 [Lutibacter sp.]|nr:hypothetical protein [Lutibacter sp.]
MKKTILVVLIAICSSAFVNAQEISDNAIGLRLGDNNGLGTEISYQKQLSNVNRLELDLGFRSRSNDSDAFKLSGIYQWVWQIDGGFNWYAGFGAGIGSWENNNINSNDNDGVFLNAAGNIGIEYNFDAPILISLDVRPEIGLLGNYSDTDLDLALSVRYQF